MKLALPNVSVDASSVLAIAAIGAVGVLLVVVYLKRDNLRRGLDPTSRDNYFYSGVNDVGAAVTGDKEFSLGAWLYNMTHPDENAHPWLYGVP